MLASSPLAGLERVSQGGGDRMVTTVRLAEQLGDLEGAPAGSFVVLSRAASEEAVDYRLDMALRWAAIHQVARNTVNDKRRSISVSGDRAVECAGVELLRRPHNFATADRGQHAIENARVGFLVGDRATRDSFPITIAVDAERGDVGGAR